MTWKSIHVCAAGVAIAVSSLAVPAQAQVVTFENLRDAVPGKYFSPGASVSTAESPNTLQIGFEGDANAFKACAPLQLSPAPRPCSDTRVAMDTLSFVVRAPEGYFVSSITYEQAGSGAVTGLADARGASSMVVAGLPIDLGGPFGGFQQFPAGGAAWSRSRTLEFSGSHMTIVPVSLTTGLFAYAGAVGGSARVEIESATVSVTIAPVAGTPGKKTATIEVVGFTGTYDGDFHSATGTATGPDGEDLSGRLEFDASFKDVPGGIVHWNFPADADYNGASGTAEIIINQATPVLTWPSPAAINTGTALSATQLNATADVAGSFVYAPPIGTVLPAGTHALSVAFTPADAVNYTGASATVNITVNAPANTDLQIVNPGPQDDSVGDKVRLQIHVNANGLRRRGSGDDDDDHDHRGGRLRGDFTATGLPPGLRIEDDGEIRGELRVDGTYRVIVTFTQRSGASVATAFDWTVHPRAPKDKDKGKKG